MDNPVNSESVETPTQINIYGVIMSLTSFSNILTLFYNQFKHHRDDFLKRAEADHITENRAVYIEKIKKYAPMEIYFRYIKKDESQNEYENRILEEEKKGFPPAIKNCMWDYIVYLHNLIENQCSNLCNDKGYGDLCRRRCLSINDFIDNFKSVLKLKQGTSCEPTYANTMRITSYSTRYLISQVFLSYNKGFRSTTPYSYNHNSRCVEAIKEISNNLNNGNIYFLDVYINKLINLAKTQRRFRKLYNLLFFKQNISQQTAGKYKHKQIKRNFRTLKNKTR